MGRVVIYWIGLGTLAAAVTYGTAFLVFRQIDLSFVQFASVLCAPLLQSAVLVWREEQPSTAVAALTRSVLRHPLVQPVLLLDALVLGGGLVWWDARTIGFGAAMNIHPAWTLVKAGAAAAFFAAAVLRTDHHRRAAMAWYAGVAVLFVLALEPSTSWLAAAFAQVHALVGPVGEVFQRLVFYGALFSMLLGLALRSARRLETHCGEAGTLLRAAVAPALVLTAAVVLATFNLPVVTQPWLGVADLSASVACTFVLLAAIFLATADPRGGHAPALVMPDAAGTTRSAHRPPPISRR